MSDSLQRYESQHARPLCPSPTPRVYSNSCPSSQWCHPAISSSVVPFFSCPQSLPKSGSFPMSQLFTLGGQSTGVSTSASVLPMNTEDWSPLGWNGWISLQSKGLYSLPNKTLRLITVFVSILISRFQISKYLFDIHLKLEDFILYWTIIFLHCLNKARRVGFQRWYFGESWGTFWCFWTSVLEKTLESPLDSKEIKPVNPEGNQPWIFIGRTDAKAEVPKLLLPVSKSWYIRKDSDTRKDWKQEKKGAAEDEMAG